jgi:hypothetical protein
VAVRRLEDKGMAPPSQGRLLQAVWLGAVLALLFAKTDCCTGEGNKKQGAYQRGDIGMAERSRMNREVRGAAPIFIL